MAFKLLGPGPDGWGTLFSAVTAADLDGQSLPKTATLGMESYAAANESVFGPAAGRALTTAGKLLEPTLVQWSEFLEQLHATADRIHDMMMQTHPNDIFCFAINNTRHRRVKSDLWIVLLILKRLQAICQGPWPELEQRIVWLKVDKRSTAKRIKLDKHRIIITDDGVYSGEQLSAYVGIVANIARNSHVQEVVVCPIYASRIGMQRITRAAKGYDFITLKPTRVFGFGAAEHRRILQQLVEEDVAVQIELDRPDGYISYCASLFNTLGLIHYWKISKSDAYTDEFQTIMTIKTNDKNMVVQAAMIGSTTTMFAHKLADSLSLPTAAYMLGMTVRNTLASGCLNAVCDGQIPSNAEVSLVKMTDVLEAVSIKNRFLFLNAKSIPKLQSVPAKMHRRLVGMPNHVPLIQPLDACGKPLERIHKRIQSDWTMYNDLKDAIDSNTCEAPAYRLKITKKLLKLSPTHKVRDFLPYGPKAK